MKLNSTTVISAIFALILTAFVALLPYVPFFADGEAVAGDKLMQLRHKLSPRPPDPRIIFVPIDQITVKQIANWPLPRRYHGIFLQDVATEKPKVVAWDIFFVDPSPGDATEASPPAPAPPSDNSTTNQPETAPAPNPPPTAPTPDGAGANPATAPSSGPAPASAPPSPSAPDSSPTNAPPSSAPPPPIPTTTNTTQITSTPSRYYGFSNGPASSPMTVADNAPTPASPPSPPPAPTTAAPAAGSTPSHTAPPTPSSTTPPPAPAPAPDSSATPAAAPPPPATTDNSAPAISLDDQALADGASLFTNMVTCADRNDSEPPLKDEELLPTRPLKNVSGDISRLLSSNSAEIPIPILRKESYFGFADQDTSGNTRRTMPLVVNIAGKILPSLDLQILLQYWGIDPDKVVVNLGHEIILPLPDGTQTHIPIDDHGFLTINYRLQSSDFKVEGYYGVIRGLEDKAAGKQSPERDHLPKLSDNIVLVAVNLTGTDAVGTPLENVAPGVITHLNTLNNVVGLDFLYPVKAWIWLPVYGLFLFAIGNFMFRIGIVPLIPTGLVAIFLQIAASYTALWLGSYQVPVAGPVLGILLLGSLVPTRRFWGEEREKIRIRGAMSAYLSEKVMAKVLAHPDNVKLGGVKQVITIMFCDIRGFTKYCDNRDSAEVLMVLNEYMEEMTQVVFKYDGTVDKYIGDCIMAFWNAPDEQPDHAQRAVCCAMEMRYALANFKTKRAGKDTELFECGIGIHTGEALVGNMGSSLKRNYTAMGSTVNLAARLEALTKRLNERILISEDTLKELQGDFPLTDRGEAVVPGFATPIHVYAVVADQDIGSALKVGRTLAGQQEYTAAEASEPIWKPAPLPEDADPN